MEKKDAKTQAIRNTFAKRLQNARKMLCMSQAELVTKMEELQAKSSLYKAVSSTAIERYENAVMLPDSTSIMVTLSEALRLPLGDLLRPFTIDVDMTKFKFRKKAKLGKKAQEAIKLKIQNRVEKYLDIERILGIKQESVNALKDLTIRTPQDARDAAMKLRLAWQLGYAPIAQPILILESKGVKIIEVDENPDLFDGTSNTVEGIPVIVLNSNYKNPDNKEEERRRLTCFHEYGHIVLQFGEDIDEKEQEHLCNVFANEMLIPTDAFINIFGEKRKTIASYELKAVQKMYGISVAALLKKAQELGVITDGRYRWYNIVINKPENKTFKAQIEHTEISEPMHSTRFNQLVYRALAMEMITSSKAAELLDTHVNDVLANLNFVSAHGSNC